MTQRDFRAAVTALLADRGYRTTAPRRQILDVLVSTGTPLSAAEIHRRLENRRVNLASVYRTVHVLLRLEVLRATDAIRGEKRFELTDPLSAHHHHLICQDCGRIEDLEGCPLEERVLRAVHRRVRRSRRFRIVQHDLRLIGACADCDRADPRTRARKRP
jgi:Fur family transcriptional regulator, ferric uptake regulator